MEWKKITVLLAAGLLMGCAKPAVSSEAVECGLDSTSEITENQEHTVSEEKGSQQAQETSTEELMTQFLEETIEQGQIPSYEGLSIQSEGTQEELFNEDCWYFRLGTDHEDNFVTEHHVYVSPSGSIYEYDVVEDGYFGMNVPGKIVTDGWGPLTYAAIITDPYSSEAMYYYAAQPEQDHMVIIALQDPVTVRLEKVHVDWDTYLTVADEVVQEEILQRGAAVYWHVPMAETIPEYRITVEYNGEDLSWDAVYDGENGNNVRYLHFYYE